MDSAALLTPDAFCTPTEYNRGDIYLANMDRKFSSSINGEEYVPRFLLGKAKRPVIIISPSTFNNSNVFVTPIKTYTGINEYDGEIFTDICIQEGRASLVCISQSTLIPRHSLTQINLGKVKEETMSVISDLLDQFMGIKKITYTPKEMRMFPQVKEAMRNDILVLSADSFRHKYKINETEYKELKKEWVGSNGKGLKIN